MIRPLRRLHPFLVAGAGLAAGVVALSGIADRPPPSRGPLPEAVAAVEWEDGKWEDGEWAVLSGGPPTLRILAAGDRLLVETDGVLELPEPRLYWLPDEASDLSGAVPLGGIRGSGREAVLAPPASGRVVLVALGHGEGILGEARVEVAGAENDDEEGP